MVPTIMLLFIIKTLVLKLAFLAPVRSFFRMDFLLVSGFIVVGGEILPTLGTYEGTLGKTIVVKYNISQISKLGWQTHWLLDGNVLSWTYQ